jgi:hypothetical protein
MKINDVPLQLGSNTDRGGQANFFLSPQIANPQILGLIPQ